jgi:hypothetical protein
LVTYKETHANGVIDPADPPTWTGTWHDPRFSPPADGGRPANAVTGQFFSVNRGTAAITVPFAFSKLRFWRNTGVANLTSGQVATLAAQTLGYEWDQDADNGARPPGVMQMSSTTVNASEYFVDFGNVVAPATVTHNMTLYRHASGALVFGAGTVQWVWGLDTHHDTVPDIGSASPDPNIQQATMNLFGDMGIQPQTRQSGLFPAVPSTDVAPPTSSITSPVNGANIASQTNVTISGTATDSGGGVVGGIEVSVDGGSTWRRAVGTANWTFSWRPGVLGTANLKSRAVDDTGNLEQPTAVTSVTIIPAGCPCTIWPSSTLPWNLDAQDPNAIEVGVKFKSDLNGPITGLRFYKAPANTGTHTGHLWTASGQLLGSLTFSGESASGWQQSNFPAPISITAGTTYVASYHANTGHYSTDSYYFGTSGVDSWPLHAPSAAAAGGNGVYVYGASDFPDQSYQGENYWVDVVMGSLDTTPPTVSMTAPANGASLSGVVTVSANASDNAALAGVQFTLDGVNLGAQDTTSPYSINWDTATAGNGTRVLRAVARDTAGNTTTSAAVTVSVFNADTFPPTVSISAPANGAMVVGTVNVSAAASDNNDVAGVQFLVDGALFGAEVTTPPYTIGWNTTSVSNGTHTLAARARDTANNLATSVAISVTVVNGAPVMDANVSTDKATGTATIASPAFSTTATNELLLAFVGADDNGAGQTVAGVAGGALTWQLVRRTNAQRGVSEIWRAFAATTLTNVTVTATLSQGAAASLTVMSFSGVDTSGTNGSGAIGATASGSAAAGAPTATLTTTRAKSWVVGGGNDWTAGPTRTAGANQTMVHQFLAPGLSTFWVQRTNTPTTTSPVSVTINDTSPTGNMYNLTICEVLAAGTPTFNISGTVSPTASGTGTTLTLSGASGGTTTADASGNFTFGGLGNGSYTVTPSKTGFTFSPTSQPVTVSGANVTAVNFTATPIPTWSISGTVSPAASGTGTTLTLSGTSGGTTTADASGNFTFTGLANGSYTVTPSKTGFIFSPTSQPVTVSGANVTGVNFTATSVQTWSISGTVSPAASGTGTTLTLSGAASRTTTADASGNFTFTGLLNGSYTVTPSKTGFTFTPASQPVTVNGANVAAVNFTAAPIPTWSISGTVSPAAAGTGTTLTLSGAASATTTADASGNFTFTGLANGSYTVTPSKSGFTFSPANQPVTVNGANMAGVNFTATAIPTWSISGTVSPAATGSGTTLTLSGAASRTTTADASGNFTFAGLANGAYTVTPSKTGFVFSPTSQPVSVNGANVAGIAFTIQTAPTGLAIEVNISTDQPSPAIATVTSQTFSTTADNELLLAFVAGDYLSGTNTSVTSMTGAGLTWALVVRTNTQSGDSEIWRAFAPSPLTNVSVTATLSQPSVSALTIVSFTGADTSGTNGSGAIGGGLSFSAASGAPTATITTTRANSWVFGVGNDYDNAVGRTVGPNQTLIHQYFTPTGDTYWVQRQNSTTPAAGTVVTINDTAPTGDRFNLSICEILAAP